jgi:hypothetical protein
LKQQVIKSRYTTSFYTASLAEFIERIMDFFTHIGIFKNKLHSLISTNFQTSSPFSLACNTLCSYNRNNKEESLVNRIGYGFYNLLAYSGCKTWEVSPPADFIAS